MGPVIVRYREQSLANNLTVEEIPNGKSLMYNRSPSIMGSCV